MLFLALNSQALFLGYSTGYPCIPQALVAAEHDANHKIISYVKVTETE